MIRGTTPTIVFKVKSDIDIDTMKEIWVTFKRRTREFTLKMSKGEVDVETIYATNSVMDKPIRRVKCYMKQEYTLFFDEGKIEAQIRFLDDDNIALASKIVVMDLKRVLKDGEIYVD